MQANWWCPCVVQAISQKSNGQERSSRYGREVAFLAQENQKRVENSRWPSGTVQLKLQISVKDVLLFVLYTSIDGHLTPGQVWPPLHCMCL